MTSLTGDPATQQSPSAAGPRFEVVLASDALMYHILSCWTGGKDDTVSRVALASSRATFDEELHWRLRALRRATDPELLFVSGAQQRQATSICRDCPVKRECAAEALDNKEEYGVWGGLTERQRRTLLKTHPHVESWAALLAVRHARCAPAGTG